MPLIKSKSKQAFSHNVEAEMHAGKPQKQSVAIAYAIKRRAPKKKMAEGGTISAKTEKRPMPEQSFNDMDSVRANDGKKPLIESGWTDRPELRQSRKGLKTTPIKHPKMVPQSAYSTRLRDEEDDLQVSSRVNDGAQEQPSKWHDEDGPQRQGPKVPDMQDEHSTHRKPYAKGGQIEPGDSHSRNISHRTVMEPEDHEIQARLRAEESDLEDKLPPSEDEGDGFTMHLDEEGQDRQGPAVPDMEDEHSTGRKPYAGGGKIGDSEENIEDEMYTNPADGMHSPDDSEMQPEPEAEEEHHASVAAAIMARKRKMMADGGVAQQNTEDSYSDYQDSAARRQMAKEANEASGYAEGGEVDLSRNADEDPNEEDQMSFKALKKENYSESPALHDLTYDTSRSIGDQEERDAEDEHDGSIVSAIRRKMKAKSPIVR